MEAWSDLIILKWIHCLRFVRESLLCALYQGSAWLDWTKMDAVYLLGKRINPHRNLCYFSCMIDEEKITYSETAPQNHSLDIGGIWVGIAHP